MDKKRHNTFEDIAPLIICGLALIPIVFLKNYNLIAISELIIMGLILAYVFYLIFGTFFFDKAVNKDNTDKTKETLLIEKDNNQIFNLNNISSDIFFNIKR